MRSLPILILATVSLQGAEIHGTVVENQTGYPLARATVTLRGSGFRITGAIVKTNASGIFAFAGLPSGSYTISVEHLAFAPVQYGQKRWPSRGTPLALAEGDSAALTIRMPRYGAISGTVLDENDIGLPEHEVAVYIDSRPPKLLERAKTDDRGVYRFGGLRPGSYLVRGLAKMYDGGGYLPTFYRDSASASDARPVQVKLDEQIDHVDFHALPGRLFTVSGRISGARQGTVTLSSDTGTEGAAVGADGTFTFDPVAPGQYELLGQADADRLRTKTAGFRAITVDRDYSDWVISMSPLSTVQFVFEDQAGQSLSPREIGVMVHRRSPAGEQTGTELVTGGVATLLPGHWDFALAPNPSYCAVGPPGWREMLLGTSSQSSLKFVLSSICSTLSGTVKDANGVPLGGVTVFVEPESQGPVHTVYTDPSGQYTVSGLAPGVYRVVASDVADMDVSRGRSIKIEEGSRAVLDLEESVMN